MIKSVFTRTILVIASTVGFGSLVVTQANALGPAYCNGYASQAVNQFQTAKGKGCSVGGARWHANFHAHKAWCMSLAHTGPANSERQVRQQKIATCGSSGVNPVCHLYANEALKSAAQAAALNCGFGGLRWIQDYQAHYRWCMQVKNPALGIMEHTARASMLGQCKGN